MPADVRSSEQVHCAQVRVLRYLFGQKREEMRLRPFVRQSRMVGLCREEEQQ